MAYQDVFTIFCNQVTASVQEGTFAKLTMAKTVGKPDLRNVFVRPIYNEDYFKVLLKLRYRSRETEDVEKEMTLDEAFKVLKTYLKNPFLSVLAFTTTKDITFKINKKGAGSIAEKAPTFRDVAPVNRNVE